MTISQEESAPLVVVIGATGVQGSSVIKALSESDKPYRVRGITRDPSKEVAQLLTKQGVEMVAVSLELHNKEKITEAFVGAAITFVMTNYWQDARKDREVAEGKMLVDAVQSANVSLLVWSGLPSQSEKSNGKYSVEHFDGKAEITQYAKERGVPMANVMAGIYMQNYTTYQKPRKQADDGTFLMTGFSDGSAPSLPVFDAVEDYGLFVREAIERPEFGAGSEIYAYSELISWNDLVKQLSDATGKTITYKQHLTDEQYLEWAKDSFPTEALARRVLASNRAVAEFGYFGNVNLEPSQKYLARKPRTWAEFVKTVDWSKI